MNKGFQIGWWLIIATIASMYLVSLPLAYIYPNMNEYVLSLIGETGIIIPILIGLLYSKKCGNSVKDTLGLKKFSPVLIPLCILLVIGAQYFITYVTMPAEMILIIMFGSETSTSQMLVPNGIPAFLTAFFVLCVAAPVFEELLCRGVLIKLFEKYGFAVSVISSALAFAMLHLELRSFIQIFFIGLLLGVIRVCSGSAVLTIIMHSVNNFLSLCQLMFFDVDSPGAEYTILFFAALLFPAVIYITFVKCAKYLDYSLVNKTDNQKTGISVAAIISVAGFLGFNLVLFVNRLINGLCSAELIGLFKF
ncbi:MAG: CPBP family intramembrane glutamic endopeptidase [Clostridia bacterium]|nr:CPBP family intramembrane glutamic endopeptidase [Clostridia bacterium]